MAPTSTPTKTPVMRQIEERFGRDIREVVADSYNRTRSITKVARELGVTASFVSDVIQRFDGKLERQLTFPTAATQA